MNLTYLALLQLLLASYMGLAIQKCPSDQFFMKGGPGWVYLGELLTTFWSVPLIMTGGDGDLIRCKSGGDGEATWYDGDLGTGKTNGMVGVPSGEGDREWYSTLNE
jgi:hypothetical protein